MSFFDLSQPIPPVILLIIFCAMVGLMAHADHCERRSRARLMEQRDARRRRANQEGSR